MIRNVLLVLEIVLAAAAFFGGALTVFCNRQVLAEGQQLTPGKLQVVLDMVVMDVILAVMAVAAWSLYVGKSWAGWMSMAAGIVLIGALAGRPGLARGRQWLTSALALLGIVVVVLAILLRSGG